MINQKDESTNYSTIILKEHSKVFSVQLKQEKLNFDNFFVFLFVCFLPGSSLNNSESRKKFRIQPDPDSQRCKYRTIKKKCCLSGRARTSPQSTTTDEHRCSWPRPSWSSCRRAAQTPQKCPRWTIYAIVRLSFLNSFPVDSELFLTLVTMEMFFVDFGQN